MDVKIKRISRGRFASFYGYGDHPEEDAMNKLFSWCQTQGINITRSNSLIYGFNNPNPTPELSEYGYECWLEADLHTKPEDGTRIIEYHGGDYAVTECIGGIKNMLQTWKDLYKWCGDNGYKLGHHQPLEIITGNLFDIESIKVEICCPVVLN